MPYAGNLDFQTSAIFGFWLTPFDPGVSAQALIFYGNCYCLMLVLRFQDFGEILFLAHVFRVPE